MRVGPFSGEKVEVAKPKVRAQLLEDGSAIVYYEPEKPVLSRSGDDCVVALCDQWFLDYGETEWRALTEKCLEQLEVYMPEMRRLFAATLAWLRQWACSRSYGLGSRLPCDQAYLIESLSDSTIYMAYYTVAHILQGGVLDGGPGGTSSKHGITAADMTNDVWDWVFKKDAPMPTGSKISEETLRLMRREFRYFYPFDLRVSGKDLVTNHLSFSLYNHTAMWADEPAMWPRSMRANGHLQLNCQKMSKSTGNFKTLVQAVEEYGADAMRFTLAIAGDTHEDANFEEATANKMILRLFIELEWYRDVAGALERGELRTGPANERFADQLFAAQIDSAIAQTRAAYDRLMFREAMLHGFYTLQNARDAYRDMCGERGNMHADLTRRFLEVQVLLLQPITPHYCEYIWGDVLKRSGSVLRASFPTPSKAVDESLIAAGEYFQATVHDFRMTLIAQNKPKKGKKAPADAPKPAKPTTATVWVAREYPAWQRAIADALAELHAAEGKLPDKGAALKAIKTKPEVQPHMKKAMPFVAKLVDTATTQGSDALKLELAFDEQRVLEDNVEYLRRTLELQTIDIKPLADCGDNKVVDRALPLKPVFLPQA